MFEVVCDFRERYYTEEEVVDLLSSAIERGVIDDESQKMRIYDLDILLRYVI